MGSPEGKALMRTFRRYQISQWPENPASVGPKSRAWSPQKQEMSLLASNAKENASIAARNAAMLGAGIMQSLPSLARAGSSVGRLAYQGLKDAYRSYQDNQAKQNWANENYPKYLEDQKNKDSLDAYNAIGKRMSKGAGGSMKKGINWAKLTSRALHGGADFVRDTADDVSRAVGYASFKPGPANGRRMTSRPPLNVASKPNRYSIRQNGWNALDAIPMRSPRYIASRLGAMIPDAQARNIHRLAGRAYDFGEEQLARRSDELLNPRIASNFNNRTNKELVNALKLVATGVGGVGALGAADRFINRRNQPASPSTGSSMKKGINWARLASRGYGAAADVVRDNASRANRAVGYYSLDNGPRPPSRRMKQQPGGGKMFPASYLTDAQANKLSSLARRAYDFGENTLARRSDNLLDPRMERAYNNRTNNSAKAAMGGLSALAALSLAASLENRNKRTSAAGSRGVAKGMSKSPKNKYGV